MRVVLVGPEKEENLSLRYLSASLIEAGHEAEIAPFERPGDQLKVIDACQSADIIGLSMCFQSRAKEFLEVASIARERHPRALIVAGGHFASCTARDLLTDYPQVDMIGIHEGERTIVEIANWWSDGRGSPAHIQGIAYRDREQVRFTPPRPIVADLDTLPTPDRRGPVRTIAGVPTAYVFGSRGCLSSCDYCCISTLHSLAPGPVFRQRAPERIADEMALLYRERGVRQFVFHDDNFLVPSESRNSDRLDALDRAFEDRGLSDIALYIKCKPADFTMPIAEHLQRMGLVRLFLGIESSSTAGLSSLGREQTSNESERAFAVCDELGIPAQFNVLIFHPNSTVETIRADIELMRRHMNHGFNFGRVELNAGTRLERRLLREGKATGSYFGRGYRLNDPVANLVWEAWRAIFFDRCSVESSLLNDAILLDYLNTSMKRFYTGPPVEKLAGQIDDWRERTSRTSIELLTRVVDACEARPDAGSPELIAVLKDIRADEFASRRDLRGEYERLFDDINRLTLKMVGLEEVDGKVRAAKNQSGLFARHLAAVSLAFAVAGTVPAFGCCDYEQVILDTDYDGLFDDLENSYFGTDPGLPDTDGDGTRDEAEDHDSDGITNAEEQDDIGGLAAAAGRGDLREVRRLIKRDTAINAYSPEHNYTPLGEAARFGHLNVVGYLLAEGADLEAAADHLTALDAAVFGGQHEAVALLIESGAALETEARSALWHAVYWNKPEIARILLEAGARTTFRHDGKTLLHEAVERGRPGIVSLLLEYDADTLATDMNGDTPLDIASRMDRQDLADLIRASASQ